ncbi:MAG: NUDIX domain-containing protein [Acidimicrobiia bacterium]|nr:NUDIX domain-containing protein [Acidimicrobiia bacterium]
MACSCWCATGTATTAGACPARRAWRAPATQAAHREVLEEVALEIELVGEPAVTVDPLPQRIDVIFRARLADADIAVPVPSSPEIVEARWFLPDDLPELQFETSNALVNLARSARAPQAYPLSARPSGLVDRHPDAV